ncbi:SH3 domain-containing protein [Scytonema sp. UIC 10036]|nr:SH3 domain-containing protein [Scytonema sp. UIC 10036]MUH00693.1 SH3 domain-containing protein [Scytonema sp. UIC 10036]
MSTVAVTNWGGTNWASFAVERTVQQGINQIAPTISQKSSQFLLAQTSVGSCVVSVQSGSTLNVRQTPNNRGKIVGSLRNGTRVALGVTDGSEGNNWTRIIAPVEGYVASSFLKNCRTRG